MSAVVLVLVAALLATPARRRRGRSGQDRALHPLLEPSVGSALLADLARIALVSGTSLPGALAAVGKAVGGPDGADLVRVAALLSHGADWSVAWAGAGDAPSRLAGALEPCWRQGVAPAGPLVVLAETERDEAMRRAMTATARLGVRLVLPLGLCFLPAFLAIGVVPVVLSVASQLF